MKSAFAFVHICLMPSLNFYNFVSRDITINMLYFIQWEKKKKLVEKYFFHHEPSESAVSIRFLIRVAVARFTLKTISTTVQNWISLQDEHNPNSCRSKSSFDGHSSTNPCVRTSFVQRQISSAIVEVQEAVLQQEPRLAKATIPVPSLHITLLVTYLANQEQVDM